MYKLYYTNRSQVVEHGSFSTCQDLIAYIYKWLESVNFKSYYTRQWTDPDGKTWIDFGSHVNFFYYVKEVTND